MVQWGTNGDVFGNGDTIIVHRVDGGDQDIDGGRVMSAMHVVNGMEKDIEHTGVLGKRDNWTDVLSSLVRLRRQERLESILGSTKYLMTMDVKEDCV